MTDQGPSYDNWRSQVSDLFVWRYGASWTDLCGDEGPLLNAYEDCESPSSFVAWWAVKYDLDPVDGPFNRPISWRGR